MTYRQLFPLLSLLVLPGGCGIFDPVADTSTSTQQVSSNHVSQALAERNAEREVGGRAISNRTQLMSLQAAGAHAAPPPLTLSDPCYVVYVDLSDGSGDTLSGYPTKPTTYLSARLIMDAKTGLVISYIKSPNPL